MEIPSWGALRLDFEREPTHFGDARKSSKASQIFANVITAPAQAIGVVGGTLAGVIGKMGGGSFTRFFTEGAEATSLIAFPLIILGKFIAKTSNTPTPLADSMKGLNWLVRHVNHYDEAAISAGFERLNLEPKVIGITNNGSREYYIKYENYSGNRNKYIKTNIIDKTKSHETLRQAVLSNALVIKINKNHDINETYKLIYDDVTDRVGNRFLVMKMNKFQELYPES